jgi:hypothetical protein
MVSGEILETNAAKVTLFELASWSEFSSTIDALNGQAKQWQSQAPMPHSIKFLYRGQHDAAYALDTTLERTDRSCTRLIDYWRKAFVARPQVEAFTDRQWSILSPPNYDAAIKEHLFPNPLPGTDYLAYLRHHGYPSPLLDWTASPYVAAFFSFLDPPKGAERVAVYVYCQSKSGHHVGADAAAEIYTIGPYVRTHQRHFLQQSQYTFCVRLHPNNDWRYASHEDVFQGRDSLHINSEEQDLLWKITIPVKDRIEALRQLESYNITRFSLMPSEESLLATIALREFHFRALE